MPKKKTPVNAFYFFMLDRKVQFERIGHKFPNGLKDVAVEVGPEWEVLPADQRKKYEDMAKEEKAKQKGDTARKYTNQHNSFDFVDRSKAEEKGAKENMFNEIENTIKLLCAARKIAEHKFYLIHTNYFCISDGETYHPAELAVAEFSLSQGVTNTYHTIINPGRLPIGYRHDAMQKSESVHRIPLEPEEGETRLYTIWSSIREILENGRSQHGGEYPPMYTMPDNVNLNTSMSCVKSVIRFLSESDPANSVNLKIFAIEKLFYELQKNCVGFSEYEERYGRTATWPSVPYACTKLEEDTYNYTSEIACSFHFNEDHVVNCSKSFVQRWAFLICDECCQYLRIQLVPGKHVPLKADVSSRTRDEDREFERNASAKVASRPFTLIDHGAGKVTKTFVPVELQRPPLAHPKVQPSLSRPAPKPIPSPSPVYAAIDRSEDNFPSIPIGRGRGSRQPRGVGRGSEPPSYSAAMQSRK